MTFREIIEAVDGYKPNSIPMEQKFLYLVELEGRAAADVMLMDIADIRCRERVYARDLDETPLITHPHQNLLRLWLEAMIDKDHGEYNKYQNSMILFNAAWENFANWFARTYRPAQGYPPGRCPHCEWDPPYYISDYSLAVMSGFRGTLAEWLASLKGDPGKGPYECALERGYTGSESEFWSKILGDYAVKKHEHTDEEWLQKILSGCGGKGYASAKGSAASLSLPADSITQLTLDTWISRSDDIFLFSGGGIKAPKDGTVMVSGTVYITASGDAVTNVFVYKNGLEVASAGAFGLYGSPGMAPIVIPVKEGDVFTLHARHRYGGSCVPNAKVTHLDVVYL